MSDAMSGGPGLDQIEQAVQPLFAQVGEALTILADAVQELKGRVDDIDGQFGGFTTGLSGVIDKRRKGEFVGSLREKYPDFGKFEEIIRQLADVDVYEEIGNDLYEYKSAPDYSDEGLEGKVKEMLGEISGKFGPILEALEKAKASKEMDKPAGEKPVTAVEVEMKSGVDPKLRKYLKTAK